MRVLAASLLVVATASVSSVAADDAKPNVLFIFTDDQRHDALGSVDHPWVQTPHLDALAARGTRFENAFVTLSICSPSRAAVLTGLYGSVNGVTTVGKARLRPGLKTIAHALQNAGYRTGHVGKWHLGNTPEECGFETSEYFMSNGPYYGRTAIVDGEKQTIPQFIDDWVAEQSVQFMEQAADDEQPFFLWMCTQVPHMDHQFDWPATDEYLAMYDAGAMEVPQTWDDDLSDKPPYLRESRSRTKARDDYHYDTPEGIRRHRQRYAAAVTQVDHSIGTVLDALDDLGLTDSTYVIVMGDNGWFLGEHGFTSKVLPYEESIRVPLIIAGPGIPPRVEDRLALNIDVAATILDVANVEPAHEMHGRSLRPLFDEPAGRWRADFLYEAPKSQLGSQPLLALRTDRWKYVRTYADDRLERVTFEEFYDLQHDASEMHNLSGEPAYRAQRQELSDRLDDLQREVATMQTAVQVEAEADAAAPIRAFPKSDEPIVIAPSTDPPLQVSGVYPHLAAFNGHGECGIGGVVPWAGRLWWLTYPPHMRSGSNDKLYSTDESMTLTVHPESVGGTHAARMIHRPSNQLFLGPYAIDADGHVRAMDVQAIPGRYTAFAEHLSQPDEKVYLFDMEGPIWEIDTQTLAGNRLFVKPVPGWHGKGAYTSQGRLVIANNGESSAGGDLPKEWEYPKSEWETGGEAAGALAEYDGTTWNIVMRRQFVEVAGPGGIDGADSKDDVLWAMGWDKRSVLLEVLDGGEWSTYRLPKASHAMDPRHGWYTEWPRIRPVTDDTAMLCMHGMLYDFPLAFGDDKARGIRPLCSHLMYVTDFCRWNDRLVISSDDTSIMENPMAGQSQSNLWFGSRADIEEWGPGAAFGGPWLGDQITPGERSDWYLFAGFQGRMVHLAAGGGEPVDVEILYDRDGTGQVAAQETVTIPASGYTWHHFDDEDPAEWVAFNVTNRDRDQPVTISAYLHYAERRADSKADRDAGRFAGLRPNDDPGPPVRIRPAGHNRNLQVLVGEGDADAYEVDETLTFHPVAADAHTAKAAEVLAPQPVVRYDEASAIVDTHDGRRLRFPVVPGTTPVGRDVREVQSERSLAHIGNIFYEVPRGEAGKHVIDYRRCRPVSSHRFAIHDFCTWRGLLVLAAANPQAANGGHVFAAGGDGPALWFGCVDDLWSLGKPVGIGGPWHQTPVKANEPSDPYLMTGFDKKSLTLVHKHPEPVTVRLEIDYSNRDFWKPFATLTVPAGESLHYDFPAGYSAHWIRLVTDTDCEITARFEYR